MRPTISRPRIIAAAVAVLVPVALTGCSGSENAQPSDPRNLKVGVQPVVAILPLFAGIQQGFFEAEGLTIKPVSGQAGPALVSQTLNGQLDLAFIGSPVLINAVSSRIPLQLITPTNETSSAPGEGGESQILVSKTSPARSARDLSGKRVAVNSLESLLQTAARSAIERDGGDGASVRFVEIPFQSMLATMRNGEVDAVVTAEPFVTQGLAREARSLTTLWDKLPPGIPVAALVSTERFSGNPELVAKFRRAWAKSVQWSQANPQKARQVLPTYTRITPQLASKISVSSWTQSMSPAKAAEGLQQLAALELAYGYIRDTPQLTKVVPS